MLSVAFREGPLSSGSMSLYGTASLVSLEITSRFFLRGVFREPRDAGTVICAERPSMQLSPHSHAQDGR